jgi:STE24 endopeptidase
MVEALDRLAVSAGNIHLEPNWHHYSIQQRIDFINQADSNRSLIRRHSKQVHSSLIIYFLSLLISAALLVFLSTHMS